MIKLKLHELKGCEEALRTLMTTRMPMVASFKFSKIIDKLGEELKRLEDTRIELVKKLGEVQEDGNIKIVDPEKYQEFQKELGDLLETEVTLEGDKVSVQEMGANLEMSPADLFLLGKYFLEV